MLTYVGYLALVGLLVPVGGFLLALVNTGEVGFSNDFGSWLGRFGLAILAVTLVLGLLMEGFRRLSDRRAG